MKKIRLKKKIKRLLILALVIILIGVFGINKAIKSFKQKQYEKTYEYKLINNGYNKNDAIKIIKEYKDKEIEYILERHNESVYLDLLNEKYFIYDNFYRYIDYYHNGKNINLTNAIAIVNTNRDRDYYTEPLDADTSKNELVLVNKYYKLKSDYVPKDLVSIPLTYSYGESGSKQVTKDTYEAFIKMWNASHENGFYLMVSSAYRSYESQEETFNTYKKQKGEEYALEIAALPGYSEHQTGYALDIFEKGVVKDEFENTESYKWLQENAYLYGFIERYPKNSENITGYTFESWHYRYVGEKVAKYIHDNNITFDEYYAYFIK